MAVRGRPCSFKKSQGHRHYSVPELYLIPLFATILLEYDDYSVLDDLDTELI